MFLRAAIGLILTFIVIAPSPAMARRGYCANDLLPPAVGPYDWPPGALRNTDLDQGLSRQFRLLFGRGMISLPALDRRDRRELTADIRRQVAAELATIPFEVMQAHEELCDGGAGGYVMPARVDKG